MKRAVFAWIPTITSVSRQAAFAGKPPICFPASIHTTDKEPGLWRQFWVDQGLTQHGGVKAPEFQDTILQKIHAASAKGM